MNFSIKLYEKQYSLANVTQHIPTKFIFSGFVFKGLLRNLANTNLKSPSSFEQRPSTSE